MPQYYDDEFKKKIVRLHLQEGRTIKSLTTEYGISKASVSKWSSDFSNECRTEEEMYRTVEEFAYVTYNHVRPHSYNGYCTPHQRRTAA